jgi:hypothetical protein
MYWSLDVLDAVFAHVFECARQLTFDVVPDHLGQRYAADWRKRLDARSYVDTVAVNVVAVDNNVAQIDADPIADLLRFGEFHRGLLRGLLNR